MAKLSTLVSYLDSLLAADAYQDSAFNGLQVEAPCPDVRKVAFAVDAGLSVIEAAIEQDAQLLVVHHGLLWGDQMPITGNFATKINLMLKRGLSLYASHLPLDGHREVGNAFELARFFGLEQIEPHYLYKGSTIGARGLVAKPLPIDYFRARAIEMIGATTPLVLPFGSASIRTVGIATGSASFAIAESSDSKLDLFITGEPKQEAYHTAKEYKMNVLFGGHYATETFGVRALSERMKKDLDLAVTFVNEPTGI